MEDPEQYKVNVSYKPSFNFDEQTLRITTEFKGFINQISREEINFKEECVKQCLISLGWTPPKQSTPLCERYSACRNPRKDTKCQPVTNFCFE